MKRILQFDYNLFLIFLSLLATLNSCGGGVKSSKKSFSGLMQLSEEAELTLDERTIATRICYAYQSKASAFRTTDYLGGQFSFAMTSTDCSGSTNTYNINSLLKYNYDNILEYQPTPDTSKFFNRGVQTNTAGYLTQLCDKVKTNQKINNTFMQGELKVQIDFLRDNALDGFRLRYFIKDSNGIYKGDSLETFMVRTSGQILGMDEHFTRQKLCPNTTNKNSEMKQIFTQFVK